MGDIPEASFSYTASRLLYIGLAKAVEQYVYRLAEGNIDLMPPTRGSGDGQKKKNPLWALLTGCTSCKSGQTPPEVTIQDAPARRNAPGERKKTKAQRKNKQRASGGADTSSVTSWETTGSLEVGIFPGVSALPPMPVSSLDTQRGLGNGIQPNGVAPLGRTAKYNDASVQTDADTADRKENIRELYQAKRRQRLGPRHRRHSDKSDSDGEGYSSDMSDGKSSPKRRRRRKYSDVVRVERIFIEKNTHTKEEVTLDKLRRKRIKARNTSSSDEIEINNYDSEGEVPINRSHRLGSMRSLHKYSDSSTNTDKPLADDKPKSSGKQKKYKTCDPPSRLILQHVHFNQFVTQETEVVKYLPATENMNVDGEMKAPLLLSGDTTDAPAAGIAGPIVTSTQPTSADPKDFDNKDQNRRIVTNVSEHIETKNIYEIKDELGLDPKREKVEGYNVDFLESGEPTMLPGEIPPVTFPEEHDFAKVERSPTLERKHITEVVDIRGEESSDSDIDISMSNVGTDRKSGSPVGNIISSVSLDREFNILTQDSVGVSSMDSLESGDDRKLQITEMDAMPDRAEHGAQTLDLQDFAPAVVNHIENSEKGEYLEPYQKDMPNQIKVIPAGISQPVELLSGMTTHTPAVLKAGKLEVRNSLNFVDTNSVGLECDIAGYESFIAGLEKSDSLSDDLKEVSSNDAISDNNEDNPNEITRNISSPSRILVNSETQTDDGYSSERLSSPSSENGGLLQDGHYSATGNRYGDVETEITNYYGTIGSANGLINHRQLDINEHSTSRVSDLAHPVNLLPNSNASDNQTIQTQTDIVNLQTNETQTLANNGTDASFGSDDQMKNVEHSVMETQTNVLLLYNSETQTTQAKISDNLDSKIPVFEVSTAETQTNMLHSETNGTQTTGSSVNSDVALCTMETQTNLLQLTSQEMQTLLPKVTNASTGSDEMMKDVVVSTTETQTNALKQSSREIQTTPLEVEHASSGSDNEMSDGVVSNIETQTNRLEVNSRDMQTIEPMVENASVGADDAVANAVVSAIETQTLSLQLNSQEIQTLDPSVTNACVGPDDVMKDVVVSTMETQTNVIQQSSQEIQTMQPKFENPSTGSDEEMRNGFVGALETNLTNVIQRSSQEIQTIPPSVKNVSSGPDDEVKNIEWSTTETQTNAQETTDPHELDQQATCDMFENEANKISLTPDFNYSKYEPNTTESSCQTGDLDLKSVLHFKNMETQTATTDENKTASDISCQADLPAADQTRSESDIQEDETYTATMHHQRFHEDGVCPDETTNSQNLDCRVVSSEETGCQTDVAHKVNVDLLTRDTQTVQKEVIDSGNDADMPSGGDKANCTSEMSSQTEGISDSQVKNVVSIEHTDLKGTDTLPVISYENITLQTPTTIWKVSSTDEVDQHKAKQVQSVSFGCQVGDHGLDKNSISDTEKDEVFTAARKNADEDSSGITREPVRYKRRPNLKITKLDQINIEPDLAHQVVAKNVTFKGHEFSHETGKNNTVEHGLQHRVQYKIDELRVDTISSTEEMSAAATVEQTSPLSVSSEPITCSSSREYSPDNDRSYPSEDETPLSPLPLDETPDSGFADSPNFIYKKVRLSSVDPSDLELSADRLSPVVETFPENESLQNWEGTVSVREDSYAIKERRKGVSTLSTDYSSTDDNLKSHPEEKKKPITLKRTGSSSPRRGRRTSPMRPRRYISSDESSEEDEQEESDDVNEYKLPTMSQRKMPDGKSPNLASTPAKSGTRYDLPSTGESDGSSGKYQWPQHGQHDGSYGDFSGDMDDSYHKDLRTDGSSTPSGYGSMADDNASTDGSILDRSDDNVLDRHLTILNDSQIAWHLPRHSPAGQAMAPRMVFTTDDGTEILVRSPADGALSPANAKSPRSLTPKEQETLFKDIPYEKLDIMVQKVLMAYIDRCGFLETKMSEVQKERDGLAEDNHSMYEKTEQLHRKMSLMEIEIQVMRKELACHATYRTVVSVESRYYSRIPIVGVFRSRTYPRM